MFLLYILYIEFVSMDLNKSWNFSFSYVVSDEMGIVIDRK